MVPVYSENNSRDLEQKKKLLSHPSHHFEGIYGLNVHGFLDEPDSPGGGTSELIGLGLTGAGGGTDGLTGLGSGLCRLFMVGYKGSVASIMVPSGLSTLRFKRM